MLAQQARTPYRDMGARAPTHAHRKRATGEPLTVRRVHVYLGKPSKKKKNVRFKT